MVKIEKNVPMPETKGKGRNPIWQNLALQMEIGDSVLLKASQAMSFRKGAEAVGRKIKQTTQGCPQGKARVWRVE